MNEMIKNTLKLTLITLIAGALLGLVYMVTKEPIARQQEKLRRQAWQAVYPDAASFEEVSAPAAEQITALWQAADLADNQFNEIILAKDEAGTTVGYVITVTSKAGYGGDIKLSFGLTADGTIRRLYLLSISETAGLGMKAKEEPFLSQFNDQSVETLEVKRHTGQPGDGYIDAISGATITSRAITRAVNAGRLIPSLLPANEKGGVTP
ncbi:MAG: RnfABCDGE type electron transport complex subunit G [Eubacteriales bacterium]|nr:RnfABCDGE type electron transport complex subunit G [Eubacteriales bacterium]